MSKIETASRSVADMLATNPSTVEQNLARVWHRTAADLVSAGVPAGMVEQSLLAAALVRAVRSEGAPAVISRLRDAADAFENEILAGRAEPSTGSGKLN